MYKKPLITVEQVQPIIAALVFDMGMPASQIIASMDTHIIRYDSKMNFWYFSQRMDYTFRCTACDKDHTIKADSVGIHLWKKHSELIQNVFPHLSATERGCMIDNLCPECEDKLFDQFKEDDE